MFHHIRMKKNSAVEIEPKELDSVLYSWSIKTGEDLRKFKLKVVSLTELVKGTSNVGSKELTEIHEIATNKGSSGGILLIVKDDIADLNLIGSMVRAKIESILEHCVLYSPTKEKKIEELYHGLQFQETITQVIDTNEINSNERLVRIDNLIQDAVNCSLCGKVHLKEEDTSAEPKYLTIIGNIHVNHFDTIVGNVNWEKDGIPVTHYCPECLVDILPKRIEE